MITEPAAREYVAGYYEQHADCDRFKIKSVGPSPEANCLAVAVYVEWSTDCECQGACEVIVWTVWTEDGETQGDC